MLNVKSLRVLLALCLGLLGFNSAAQQSDAASSGEQIYQTAGGYGCKACHGEFANGGGNVGGNIRGANLQQLQQALSNEPTMQLLKDNLSEQDQLQLIAYLQQLGSYQLLEWTLGEQDSHQKQTIEAKSAQLVVTNRSFNSAELSLEGLGQGQSLVLDPYASKAVLWLPKPGQYRLQYQQQIFDIEVR